MIPSNFITSAPLQFGVVSYPPGTFVPIAIATHGLVGLALGAALFDRPVAGLAAGLAPDADFLFPAALGWPFVHRGVTHALVALAAAIAVAAVLADRESAGAVGLGYGAHLGIDATTPMGVPLLYPPLAERLYVDVGIGGHAPVVTVLLWVACLGVVGYHLDGVPRASVS